MSVSFVINSRAPLLREQFCLNAPIFSSTARGTTCFRYSRHPAISLHEKFIIIISHHGIPLINDCFLAKALVLNQDKNGFQWSRWIAIRTWTQKCHSPGQGVIMEYCTGLNLFEKTIRINVCWSPHAKGAQDHGHAFQL